MIRFAEPQFLWLLLLVVVTAAGTWWSAVRRRRALVVFAGGRAEAARFAGDVHPHRRAAKWLLGLLALIALTVALARPQWGAGVETVRRHGADVVFVLDASRSMSAEDVAPNRLDLGREALLTLLAELGGDRVALVSFSGRAELLCPLTVDHAAVRLFLEAVGVESGNVQGTALAEALARAVDAIDVEPGVDGERGRAVVVVSDGEDHVGELDATIERLREAGVPVFALGVGSPTGAPIPLRHDDGRLAGYKKDRQDRVVTTRLDETLLGRLAVETGGRYLRATVGGDELTELTEGLGGLGAGEFGEALRTRYEERFQFPLGLAWLALAVEALLGDRRRPMAPVRREES